MYFLSGQFAERQNENKYITEWNALNDGVT